MNISEVVIKLKELKDIEEILLTFLNKEISEIKKCCNEKECWKKLKTYKILNQSKIEVTYTHFEREYKQGHGRTFSHDLTHIVDLTNEIRDGKIVEILN